MDNRSPTQKVYIDTRVSAEAGATTVSYKWHALFLITELAAYIPYFMLGDTHYNILIISLFLCSVLISTLSLVFHAFINKSERHVYSMDSKLNLIVNNTMKKYKSIAMLLLSGTKRCRMDLCSLIHRYHRNTSGIILLCVYFHSVNSRFGIYCYNLYGLKQKEGTAVCQHLTNRCGR